MIIVLSTSHKPASWLIRLMTFGEFSHVEVLMDAETVLGASMLAGVQRMPLTERIRKSSRYQYLEVKTTPDEERVVRAALDSQVGKGYDYWAVFGWALRQNWDTTDGWFCSELVTWAFREAGVHLVGQWAKVKRITPRDLFISPRATPVENITGAVAQLIT